jgi:hypothetical protein
MRYIKIAASVAVCLLMVQCKPKREPGKTYFDKPSEYNDFIVNEQKSVMTAFDDFAIAVNRGDIDSMKFHWTTLGKRTEMAVTEMNKLADYKEDTMFRHAALDLFKYIQLACDNELKEIVNIAAKDTTVTELDIERIHQLSETYAQQEKEKNDVLISEQEKFAKKFNVKIQ